MTVELKHNTQAVGTDAGNGEIRKAQWNENHALTGTPNQLLGFDGTGVAVEVDPGTFATAAHTHPSYLTSVSWGIVTGKPATFAPSAHSHAIADVTGLQVALDGKALSTHNHDLVYAALLHGHSIAEVSGLQSALDGKQAAGSYATAAQGLLANTAVQPGDDADTLGSGAATEGQVLTSDGLGNAAWADVSGGVTHPEFVAGGAISAGDPVILNEDGHAEKITDSFDEFGLGSFAYPTAKNDGSLALVYEPINRVLVALFNHKDDDGLLARVGTIDGEAVAFPNAPVNVGGTNYRTSHISAVYHPPSGKIIAAYRENYSLYDTYLVPLTVSGTTVSGGTRVYQGIRGASTTRMCYDESNGYIVFLVSSYNSATLYRETKIDYWDVVGGSLLKVATETLDFNNTVPCLSYDPISQKIFAANKVSVFVVSIDSSNQITVSTTPTSELSSNLNADNFDACYDSVNERIIVATGSSSGIYLYSFTINGDTPVLESESLIVAMRPDTSSNSFRVSYDAKYNKIVVFYRQSASPYYGYVIVVDFSGSAFTAGDAVVLLSSQLIGSAGLEYDSHNDQYFTVYSGGYAYLRSFTSGGGQTTANQFLGFAQNSASASDLVSVATQYQISKTQSGLILGEDYWIDFDGSLSINDTGYPKAGKALSSTMLQIGV